MNYAFKLYSRPTANLQDSSQKETLKLLDQIEKMNLVLHQKDEDIVKARELIHTKTLEFVHNFATYYQFILRKQGNLNYQLS